MTKTLPVLYARTSKGAIQQWQITVKDNTHFSTEGQKGGKLTVNKPTVVKGKNTGKANETSDSEQALKEAQAKHQKKIDSGYFENLADIDNEIHTEPMLAQDYKKVRPKWKSWIGVYSQPKLDGMRCIAKKNGLFSRNGKPIKSVPHILKALQPLFAKNPNAIFDGELYCDKFANDFNAIISLCKQAKPNAEDFAASEKSIQYWVYDQPSSKKTFGARHMDLKEDLKSLKNPCIVSVPTLWHDDESDLDTAYEKYIADGYEGQMVRLDAPYEFKRSKNLLKRKEFIDEEYIILKIGEGEGGRAGTAGYSVHKAKNGKEFRSNIKGSHKFLKKLLEDAKEVEGQPGTLRYFNLTPDGIPRFPFLVAVRNYE